MKYIFGTDNRTKDYRLIWINYVLCFIFAVVFIAGGLFLIYSVFTDGADPFGLFFGILCMIGLMIGFMESAWLAQQYKITGNGVMLKSLIGKRYVYWQEIYSIGVFQIFDKVFGDQDYIVVFLTEKKPHFPITVTDCFFFRRKMLAIRATPERLDEMNEAIKTHYSKMAAYHNHSRIE